MSLASTQRRAPPCTAREERTRLIYEDIPGCSPPPFFDLSRQTSLKSFESTGVVLNRWSEGVLRIGLRLSGADSLRRDPSRVESLLRSVSLRTNYFAPVMSATAALADHPSPVQPLERAVALLLGTRSMHQDLFAGRFSPDRHGNNILEMGQYANLFSTHVIHDGNRFRLFKSTCTSQITVLRARRLYTVDSAVPERMWTQRGLLKALNHIRAESGTVPADGPDITFPAISAAQPETQAEIFALLSEDPAAMEALSALRHSFVTLCLDLDSRPSSPAEAAALAQSGNFSNRWYSSALQIFVFGNSKACLIFTFNAYLDGNVQMRAASEIWKRSVGAAGKAGSDADGESFASREIVIPVKRELLDKVQKEVTSVLHDDPATFEVPEFGKPFFLSRGLSPVPAFVAALQLALFRITGRTPRIGQLLTMSRYRCLDLATAFVTTPEMINFVHSMADSSGVRQQLRDLLCAAVDSQIAACRDARRCFPVFRLHPMMADRARGIRRFYLMGIIRGTNLLLRMLKLADDGPGDILISHPQVYDEVHFVGRPGVRVPYLKCFGLHYQILERSIVLTWMPAMDWEISNAEMTKEVVRALEDIGQLAKPETPVDGTKSDSSLE